MSPSPRTAALATLIVASLVWVPAGNATSQAPSPAPAAQSQAAATPKKTAKSNKTPLKSDAIDQKSGAPAQPTTSSAAASASTASADSMSLQGGEEGTVFKSMTVTGEDRIRVEFDRPELRLSVDPRKAPGLENGDSKDVLRRTGVDLDAPLVALSTSATNPYTARPWLSQYRSGAVARFRPQLKGVSHWWLTIADSRSDTLATFQGDGEPPDQIEWDGRSRKGQAVPPGITCSYVVEAKDRAGNRRSFVGAGFTLPAYRVRTALGETMLFSGSDLGDVDKLAGPAAVTPPILLETASWLNQIEPVGGGIEVKVSARSFESANQMAKLVVDALRPCVVGDPARLRAVADVRSDVPPQGTVAITAAAAAAAAKAPAATR